MTDPEKNVAQFFLKEGNKVADLGAGSGAYAVAAGKRVGETGRVYAVEVQKEMLPKISKVAREADLENIEVLWGDIEERRGTKIENDALDAVILSNVLFQVEDKDGLLGEAFRILKSDGRVLVVDWSESFGGLGPQQSDVVSKDEAQRLLGKVGFEIGADIDAGEHHYGFTAVKP